ncbi:hypothetical protein COV42_01750 [Candidatus Campbellbacteria bacterium CG11_big_fil_rev_8_21_14_0_20_44_21]|nr:MAG: hypothetical protein COV42_01750 [Candidatus Campbellbacteria bacterium CG11_big_fil_rev_8_21_14_0_20_44_21]
MSDKIRVEVDEDGTVRVEIGGINARAVFNRLGGVGGARRFLRGELTLVEAEGEPLLGFVRTVRTTPDEPTIVYTSSQFKDWFHEVPEGARAEELTLRKLERKSHNSAIITALGGEEMAAVTWADFKSALAEKEDEGDHMFLLGYMEDKNGVLRAVDAFWDGVGWYVRAFSLGDPDRWLAGLRVLSRN